MAYWLMKSEPETYSVSDLQREGTNLWEGCRNYTVRNFFRDRFSVGDLAFFYHSVTEPVGIVGVMRVIEAPVVDPTQFDAASEYYDPKSPADNPRWMAVIVEHVATFPRVLTLAEIKADELLSGMEVAKRGQRLSVMPVTEAEWLRVHDLLGI